MKGIEQVSREVGEIRRRISRLIELETLSQNKGKKLLFKILDIQDFVDEIERDLLKEKLYNGN